MERYRYDPKLNTEKIKAWPYWHYDVNSVRGFAIYDMKIGTVDGAHIAFCRARDDAEKIVAALNAVDKGGQP